MTQQKQMHLSLNLSEFGRHSGAWRHPMSNIAEVPSIDRYIHQAQVAERGKFDLVFIADTPVHVPGASSVTGTRLEPFEILAAIAAETSHIGMIGTISTSYNEPLDVARRATSLDHLSGGRLGINYVASTGDLIAKNFNLDGQLDHDLRYSRSREFLDAVLTFWGAAADPAPGGRRTTHHGEHFDLEASLGMTPPVHGRPVIVQAGSSEQGRDLAARYADAIYAGGSTIERAQEYYRDIKARTEAYGRDPESIKILLGIMPFIGDTLDEAVDLHRSLDDLHTEGADLIGHLSKLFEHDLRPYDPAGPVPFDDLPEVRSASVSLSTLFKRIAREENLTIEQTAYRSFVGGLANMQWVSTGTATMVADEMQRWFEAGTADGFAIVAPILPRTIEDFVDQVVPLLQDRGLFRLDYDGRDVVSHLGLPPMLDLRRQQEQTELARPA